MRAWEDPGEPVVAGSQSVGGRSPASAEPMTLSRNATQFVRRKPVKIPSVPDAAEGRLPVMKA